MQLLITNKYFIKIRSLSCNHPPIDSVLFLIILHKMLYSKSFSKAEIFSPKFKCFVPARHEFEFA